MFRVAVKNEGMMLEPVAGLAMMMTGGLRRE